MKTTLHFTFLRAFMLFAFGLSFNGVWSQTEYVWNCNSASVPTSGTNANITTGTWTQGNNNGTTALINNGSASTGYTGSSGTNNFGLASRIGSLNTATNGSAFFEITFTPATGYSLSITGISFGSRSSGTGPALASIRTSLDSYGSTVGSNALSGTWQLISPSLGAISAGQNVGITIRIYGSNGAGNPGVNTANWRVDDIKVTVTASLITTWDGDSWSNGTPTVSHDAIIAGDYSTAPTAQGSFTAKSLTVNSGVFTLATGTSLTVENAVVNNAGSSNFIVENNANLIQNNAVANTGAIKIKRNSNPLYRYDYTLWSSPVVGQNLKSFSSATLSNRFYLYNPATGTNGDYEAVFPTQNEASYNFVAGKGYLIRTADTHPLYVEGNPGTVINAEFTGTPYNQSLNTPLSNANNGFNLVGNPYPSAISISGLFSSNSDAIDGTIWFWRKRNGATGSGYATSTGLGVTSLHPEATAINTNGVIGTGQGFFVKVKAGATQNTLNFTNTLRSTNTGGSFFRNANAATTDNTEKHRIWLNLSNGTEIVGQTLLGYMAGATSGIDYAIEGKYFNDSPVAFTSFIENQEFAIQGRSLPFTTEDVVPMSFKTDVAGNYSISIDHADGLFQEGQDVFIKDNTTGQIHNIKTNAYSFASEAGVFNNRFEIAYRAQLGVEVPVISPNNIVVNKQNGSLVVNAGSYIMDKIELYDVSGRLVYSKNNIDATSAVIENLSIANQVLVVKITTAQNGTANKKIVY